MYGVLTCEYTLCGLTSLSRLNLLNSSSDSNFDFWSGTTRGILNINLGFGCSYSPIVSNGSMPARALGSFIVCIRSWSRINWLWYQHQRNKAPPSETPSPRYLPFQPITIRHLSSSHRGGILPVYYIAFHNPDFPCFATVYIWRKKKYIIINNPNRKFRGGGWHTR